MHLTTNRTVKCKQSAMTVQFVDQSLVNYAPQNHGDVWRFYDSDSEVTFSDVTSTNLLESKFRRNMLPPIFRIEY
jgi:hypothetical protein